MCSLSSSHISGCTVSWNSSWCICSGKLRPSGPPAPVQCRWVWSGNLEEDSPKTHTVSPPHCRVLSGNERCDSSKTKLTFFTSRTTMWSVFTGPSFCNTINNNHQTGLLLGARMCQEVRDIISNGVDERSKTVWTHLVSFIMQMFHFQRNFRASRFIQR